MSLDAQKSSAREAAYARRATADRDVTEAANRHLEAAVRSVPGGVVSAYWPIRTEIDPRPAMRTLSATHQIGLPVVVRMGLPLVFRRWIPGSKMVTGSYGAAIPADPDELVPQILIVPLAAFDVAGYRLGYGGGFYDRTLEMLKKDWPVTAIGFAYDVQECASVPRDLTDQRLDLIVTESGPRTPV